MANKQPATSKRARSRRDGESEAGRRTSQNGDGEAAATRDQQLSHYLQERITPGLSRGAIRLLAHAVTKGAAHRRPREDADAAGEASGQEDDVARDEADDFHEHGDVEARLNTNGDFSDGEDENERSLEAEMRDLQANLGNDWILRVCVQGDYAWLAAETHDGSQYVEAPAADRLAEVVELLKGSGDRSS